MTTAKNVYCINPIRQKINIDVRDKRSVVSIKILLPVSLYEKLEGA
jgi:hypothetical protein